MDIRKGARPQFDANWPPPELIQKMVMDCLEENADKRPTAKELITKFQKISGV